MERVEGLFVCATFMTKGGVATRGLLLRAALQIASPEPASVQQWNGKWRRNEEAERAEIVIKSHEDELEVTGAATWQSSVPSVQRGYYETQTGELDDSGKSKGQVLAIGYDPDRSAFPPPEGCRALRREVGIVWSVFEGHGQLQVRWHACDLYGGLRARRSQITHSAPSCIGGRATAPSQQE